MIKLANLTARQKQYLVAGGIVGVVLLASGIGVMLSGSDKPVMPRNDLASKPVKTNIAQPGAQVDPKAVWMGQSAAKIKDLEQQTKDYKAKLERIEEDMKKIREGKTDQIARAARQAAEEVRTEKAKSGDYPLMPPGVPGVTAPLPAQGSTPATTASNQPQRLPPPPGAAVPANQAPQPAPQAAIFSVSLRDGDRWGPAARPPAAYRAGEGMTGKKASRPKTKDDYIPSGSFTQGVLLSGLDAPTGGQAQSNPHPVVVRLTNLSTLPNINRFDVKECFVTGAGYGDISSERAYIRTETLSCILRNGTVVDQQIKGFLAGEDGKNGLRGRVVTKQGQILANALLAGIASGIGSSFSQSRTTTSVSPLGSTQTVQGDQVVEAGIGEGIHSAMDRLAKYYIDLANKMFPIIEIDAGRMVEVVITKGFFFNDPELDIEKVASKDADAPRPAPASLNQPLRQTAAR